MIVTSIALFLLGALTGGIAIYLVRRAIEAKAQNDSNETILDLTRENATLSAQNQSLSSLVEQSRKELSETQERQREQLSQIQSSHREQIAQIESRAKSEQSELYSRIKEEQQQMQSHIRVEFSAMADKIMSEKSDQFKQSNRESMEQMLNPFRENIDSFRKRVEEVYFSESQQRTSLKEQILQLTEMNSKMSVEANNLVAALKGNSKTQGDWGEMILETMLESSGLRNGVHYFTQQNFKDEDGSNRRPDVVVKLPDNKSIVVYSKVSIKSYIAYTESNDREVMAQAVKEHLASVRRHVDELAVKRYPDLVGDTTPDMVIMFIPNEPAFLLALQHDSELWRYAYERKVMISSPTNLFAVLKIVDDLWKRDLQSKNAIAIALESGRLYDKFVGFAESLLDLGRSIDTMSKRYDDTLSKFHSGRGNLVSRIEKLRNLGVRATKNLPEQFTQEME